MKIVITETQLKILLSEIKDEPKKKKGESESEKEKEVGVSSDYVDSTELEQLNITYHPESKKTSGKVVDWEYGGSKSNRKRKKSYWISKDIDISGLRGKINKFAKSYIDYMSNNINSYVGPVITSGYRGPKRQIDAVWIQWKGDKNYLKSREEDGVGYSRVFGTPIEKFFIDNEDEPKKAKKLAIDFLKEKEKEDIKLKPQKKTDVNALLAQRRIEESTGLNTKITTKQNKSGKVIIEFANIEQFEMLSDLLIKKK